MHKCTYLYRSGGGEDLAELRLNKRAIVVIGGVLYETNEWGKHQSGKIGLTQLLRQHGKDAIKQNRLDTHTLTPYSRFT